MAFTKLEDVNSFLNGKMKNASWKVVLRVLVVFFFLLCFFFFSYRLGFRSARGVSAHGDLLLGRDYLVRALSDDVDRLKQENLLLRERLELYSILGGVVAPRSSLISISNFRVQYDGASYFYYALISVGGAARERLFSLGFSIECEWLLPDGSKVRDACSTFGSVNFRYFSEVSGMLEPKAKHATDTLLRAFLIVKDKYSAAKKTAVFNSGREVRLLPVNPKKG